MGMFTEFQVNDGIVTLGNGGEQESIFPLSSIVAMDVNWMVASGRITFTLGADAVQRMVTFGEDDSGQECADAISDVFAAWRAGRPAGGV